MQKGIYRHFKGALYQVTGTAFHSETGEEFVIYHNTDSPEKLWVRPMAMFTEIIERDGKSFPRFEFQNLPIV